MYKRFLKTSLLVLAILGGIVAVFPARTQALPTQPLPLVFAADAVQCDASKGEKHPKNAKGEEDKFTCCPASAGENPTPTGCFMTKYINPVVNFLAALVGIVVLASVIFGAIQYIMSAGDSGKAAAAKQRILTSLGALAAFVFLYAFLQWIIPGGI